MTKNILLRNSAIAAALTAFTFSAVAQTAAPVPTLPPEAARDLARVFAPSPQEASRFTGAMRLESLRFNAHAPPGAPGNATCILPNVARSTAAATSPRDVFSEWHCLALNLLAVDHIPEFDDTGLQLHYFQFGPHRASYAAAMTHLAMYEVANAFAAPAHKHQSWISQVLPAVTLTAPNNASESAALVAAAYTMLIHLYPHLNDAAEKYGHLEDNYTQAIHAIMAAPGSGDVATGAQFGQSVADLIIGVRLNDGSQTPEVMWGAGFTPLHPQTAEFQWVPDPVSKIMVALGANWGDVKPFVIGSPDDFHIDPPKMDDTDPDFKTWYHEVRDHGGDGRYSEDVSARRMDQYLQGKFWSYDGTSGICAPVRLYNQIADTVLVKSYHDVAAGSPDLTATDASSDSASDIAHYYAMLNVALVDAGIAAWHYKYKYEYWRPVTGVRYVDNKNAGAPTAQGGFGDEKLAWGPVWFALGAQTTNSASGYNITPPFPAYPSGHSVFGSAFFEVMRALVKTDKGFDFQSDELNGPQRLGDNVDAFNYVRCKKPTASSPDPDYDATSCNLGATTKKHFTSFKDAEQQNSDSRIFLGVHWRGDSDNGMLLGTEVGDAILAASLAKLAGP